MEPPAASHLDEVMMRAAIEQARDSSVLEEVPIGAVVYRGSELLSAAHNLRESARDPTAHAEILALRDAARKVGDWRLNDCTLAVTLEPCPMCAGAIVNARVRRLIYGAADPKGGAVESLYTLCSDPRLNHRPVIVSGVLAPECGQLLREFFQRRR